MSPELELLDQLLGGDMPTSVLASLFDSEERFRGAILRMLEEGEVEVFGANLTVIPRWRWREISAASPWRARITARGVDRIG